jgi:hypothetical protein
VKEILGLCVSASLRLALKTKLNKLKAAKLTRSLGALCEASFATIFMESHDVFLKHVATMNRRVVLVLVIDQVHSFAHFAAFA